MRDKLASEFQRTASSRCVASTACRRLVAAEAPPSAAISLFQSFQSTSRFISEENEERGARWFLADSKQEAPHPRLFAACVLRRRPHSTAISNCPARQPEAQWTNSNRCSGSGFLATVGAVQQTSE